MSIQGGPLVWALAMAVCAGGLAAAESELPEISHDGLHLIADSEVAAAWVRPGADLGVYRRLMIEEVEVAFRQNWERDQNRGSVHRVRSRDVERIKQAMADLFHEVFVDELEGEGGWEIVKKPEGDVLLLRPKILDLDVSAPDLNRAGRSRNFASSAGAATLLLELYDSVSGEILARAVDRQADNATIMWRTNRVTNTAAARRILTRWARLLRDRLDELHGNSAD